MTTTLPQAPHPALHAAPRRRRSVRPVTLERLVAARKIAAGIVARYGDGYLPVFERLDKEIQTRKAKAASLSRALQIAGE